MTTTGEGERSASIIVHTYDLTDEAFDALFDRIAEAAHALDEQVFCSGPIPGPDTIERAARALHAFRCDCPSACYPTDLQYWDAARVVLASLATQEDKETKHATRD